jgi:hypothetical protein
MAKTTLELGKSSEQRIGRLQRVLDARSVVEVIRQALKLLEFIVDQVLKGKEILLRDPSTGEVERITILDLVPEAEFQVADELEVVT